MISPTQISSYLQHLPAVFQQQSDSSAGTFNFGRYLLAFEKILSGLGDEQQPGFEELINRVHTYFTPGAGMPENLRAPDEFLPWLASWVALTLREDWAEEERRRFIDRVVPLYKLRGTKAGLIEMLRTYTGMGVEINEFIQPLQVGVTSTIGLDTSLGGSSPHYFLVRMSVSDLGDLDFDRRKQIARAIIDQEKPAHTYYDLIVDIPTMQIGVTSTVGVDTVLGTTGA
ncbi:MAG: phage tail protein [Anaerolineae bacterium]|nr:phage tail protein [Anaerolineae bacterium]